MEADPNVIDQQYYWADSKDTRKPVDYLLARTYKWDDMYNNSFRQAWVRNFLAYYSPVINPGRWDTSLIFQGDQGELVRMFTPETRIAINRLKAIVTKQRLSFQCMAQVEGKDVAEEIKIGNALTDQIVQNERLNIKGPDVLEGALVCGNWFMKTIWSTEKGDPMYRDDKGRLLRTGGPEITPVSIFDTFYDADTSTPQERQWMMARCRRSRWDLMAEHPDIANYIKMLPSAQEELGASFWFDMRYVNHDTVLVYEFYHRPCSAMPNGRILIFSDANTVYYDDVNHYGCIPIEEMRPESVLDTGLGYPKLTDILPSQEMLDNTISAIATNSSQFAVQNVLVPRESDINLNEINGMRFIMYTPVNVPGGGMPQKLDLGATSQETYRFADLLSNKIDKLSLVTGALNGNLPPGVTSGTAIATLAASGIESISPYTLCYYECMERTMWHAINAHMKFGSAFQTIKMKGRNSQITGKSFNKDHIQNLTGVKMTSVNPLMQVISGRIQIAEKLMTLPKELWPAYTSIIDGEPLSVLTRGIVSQADLIALENDQMSMGERVPVLATDNHAEHIQKHSEPLNDPNVRINGSVNQIFLDHIMEHYRVMHETPPDLQFMAQTGQMPPAGGQQPPPPSNGAGVRRPLPQTALKTAPPLNPPTSLGVAQPKVSEPAQPAKDLLGRQ